MESILSSMHELYGNETFDSSLISFNKNIETKIICKNIIETSTAYNITSILGGRYIILSPCEISNNFNAEITTYVEVDIMKNRITKIYDYTIYGSLVMLAISAIMIANNILNIPVEALFVAILFSLIGIISFSIDRNSYIKETKA